MMIKCPECGRDISDKSISCPNCGCMIVETKFCKHCGEKIPKDSVVCTKCGRQVEELSGNSGGITINNAATSASTSSASAAAQIVNTVEEIPKKEINKKTALILCILLGYFGAHKFYEGKTGMGILYVCTLGLFGIGWIADIIIIAMKEDPYYI